MATYSTHTFLTDEIPSARTLIGIQQTLDALIPVGSYMMVHMTPPSSGTLVNGVWLGCDGTSLSTSTYSDLFSVIGYTYGGSSGNFNLPDHRGRGIFFDSGSGGHGDATPGYTDGAALASRRPKHQHTWTGTGGGQSHTHTANAGTTSAPSVGHSHQITNGTYTGTAAVDGTATTRPETMVANGGTTSGVNVLHTHTWTGGTMSSNATAITAVGAAGITDGPAYLVACTVLIRAL